MRWIEKKANKKSLDDDKGRLGFWLMHFSGTQLKDITEAKIYTAISKIKNRQEQLKWKAGLSQRKKGNRNTRLQRKISFYSNESKTFSTTEINDEIC